MSNVSMINGHIDNVLSDEDIVKALECCQKAKLNQDCLDLKCPFATEYGCNIDSDDLRNQALDLINRLKADKEALIKGQESLMKHLERKKEIITELDNEVERLKKENNLYSDLAKMGDALKAEVIKQFAERLKNRSEDTTDWGQPYVLCKDIDDLVEEMTVSVSDSKEFWEDTN